MSSFEIAQILSKHNLKTQSDVSLQKYNTFGIEASAELFLTILSDHDFKNLCQALPEIPGHYPIFYLGGGSNIVLTKNFEGLVIRLAHEGIEFRTCDIVDTFIVTAMAGENWSNFVDACCEKNLSGIENLALIPGTVGAAPIQNIGAYGVELKDVFWELKAFNRKTFQWRTFNKEQSQFAYRDSFFKSSEGKDYLIYSVSLLLSTQFKANTQYPDLQKIMGFSPTHPREVAAAVKSIRQQKLPDPKVIGNAGSFFKNPILSLIDFLTLQSRFPDIPFFRMGNDYVKVPAAWLIDRAEWKGKNFGTVGVHRNQALVLVNLGGATGKDVQKLASEIQEDVQNKFGITLEPEPLYV
ncbi:MAG: UDP-N-acetylmuramate dehydrogenase [Bdellovibrionia bacterium]